MELSYETLQAPATWIADNAVLAAFSSGRPTALVVDFGASGMRITPVVDGYALKGARVRTSRGGDRLDGMVATALADAGMSVKPWFDVQRNGANSDIDPVFTGTGNKKAAAAAKKGGKCSNSNTAAAAAGSSAVSAQLRNLHKLDLVRDIKRWMSFVPYMPVPAGSRDNFITNVIKLPAYELPDGTLIGHSDKMCTAAEKVRRYLHVLYVLYVMSSAFQGTTR